MSWKEYLYKGELPYNNEIEIIIKSHTSLADSWFITFIEELKELGELIKTNPDEARVKWDKMKGGRLDIQGTFNTILDQYIYIDRLLGDV